MQMDAEKYGHSARMLSDWSCGRCGRRVHKYGRVWIGAPKKRQHAAFCIFNNNCAKKRSAVKLILTMAKDLVIIIPVAKPDIAAMAE